MAKIKYTAVVADIRGKLAGSVFTKNRFGAVLRTKVTPVQPNTVGQVNARNLLASLSSQWKLLTEEQRQSWRDAVPMYTRHDIFGDTIRLTGHLLFVSLNTNRINTGGAVLSTAPSKPIMPSLTIDSIALSPTPTFIRVHYSTSAQQGVFSIMVAATPPISAGINAWHHLPVNLFVHESMNGQTTAVNSYSDLFGFPPSGRRIGIRLTLIHLASGTASTPAYSSSIVP